MLAHLAPVDAPQRQVEEGRRSARSRPTALVRLPGHLHEAGAARPSSTRPNSSSSVCAHRRPLPPAPRSGRGAPAPHAARRLGRTAATRRDRRPHLRPAPPPLWRAARLRRGAARDGARAARGQRLASLVGRSGRRAPARRRHRPPSPAPRSRTAREVAHARPRAPRARAPRAPEAALAARRPRPAPPRHGPGSRSPRSARTLSARSSGSRLAVRGERRLRRGDDVGPGRRPKKSRLMGITSRSSSSSTSAAWSRSCAEGMSSGDTSGASPRGQRRVAAVRSASRAAPPSRARRARGRREDGAADDGVADVQLLDLRDGGHRRDVLVGEPVAGVHRQPERAAEGGGARSRSSCSSRGPRAFAYSPVCSSTASTPSSSRGARTLRSSGSMKSEVRIPASASRSTAAPRPAAASSLRSASPPRW
jgi:hypothetical protein